MCAMKELIKITTSLTLLFGFLGSYCFLFSQSQDAVNPPQYWTYERAQLHAQAQMDSSQWDRELLAEDIEYLEEDDNSLPIYPGAFPVANYQTPGIGFTRTQYLSIGDKQFISTSFIANKGEHNKVFMGTDQLQEVLFTYIMLTDYIDTVNYTHGSNYAESRNHPHYLCEGTMKTTAQTIDYLAMMTGDRNNYAVINMRFFDLRFGQTILIAPQKDNSLRFLQVPSPGLNSLTAPAYVEKLLTKAEILNFFQQKGNI